MPRLSIIIPAIGGDVLLEQGLVSVLQHRPTDAEVIVVLVGSYADPYDLKQEVRFIEARPSACLIECFQEGIRVSEAPFVHLLGPGCEVGEDWADPALAAFDDDRSACVAPLVYWSETPEVVRSAGIRYSASGRPRLASLATVQTGEPESPLGPEVFAGFYRRSALEQAGGLATTLGNQLAGFDIALALRSIGYQSRLALESRVFVPQALVRPTQGWRRGLFEERLYLRHRSVVQPASWLGHAGYVLGSALAALPGPGFVTETVGRLVAMTERRQHQAYREHQQQVRRQLREQTRWEQASGYRTLPGQSAIERRAA